MARRLLCIALTAVMLLTMLSPIAAAQSETNYALGKPYTTSVVCQSSFGNANAIVTDGNKYSTSYITDNGAGGGAPVSLTLDLKASYTLNQIIVWHYWADGRTFHNTKTEISENGTDWTTVTDSVYGGEYKESEQGKLITFNPTKARYIRDWARGSDKDNESRWVEIQAFGPAQTGQEAKQNLPLNDSLESTDNITGLSPGTVTLTQDKIGGSYAVRVTAGDSTVQDWVYHGLTTSEPFEISQYNQVKLWVKPQSGAKWVEFWTRDVTNNQDCQIKNSRDPDGRFRVGTDLVSGKWNQVNLDLTKTSNPTMLQAKDLWVRFNDNSNWSYDEITTVYAPAFNLDITKMVNSKTQLANGELQFKPGSGLNTYDTTPTVLTSQKQSNFDRTDTTQTDFQAGTASNVVANANGSLELKKSGQSSMVTSTADFNGTHSNTQAVNDSLQLASGAGDSHTKLLLHCDGTNGSTTFTDEMGKTVVKNGDAVISTTQKKFGESSALFDGNGDYLSIGNSPDFNFEANDFTMDFWFYVSSFNGWNNALAFRHEGTNNSLIISTNASSLYASIYMTDGTNISVGGSTTIAGSTWNHFALARSGSGFKVYLNGTQVGSEVSSTKSVYDFSNHSKFIGRDPTFDRYFNGYIDEVRISKGIARWAGNFTPPASAYNIGNAAKLLLHSDGANGSTVFTDSATGKTVTANGNVQLSTAQNKFGGASGHYDGSGDYLSLADSDDWNFGSGDFTIDLWVKKSGANTIQTLMAQSDSAATPTSIGAFLQITASEGLNCGFYSGSTLYTVTNSFTVNTEWHHIALVRSGNSLDLYFDGTKATTCNVTGISANNSSNLLSIGRVGEYNGQYFNGYIDEIRISKGIAQWTSNFTPPASPYAIYQSSGTYTHAEQNLSGAGVANNLTFNYTKSTPVNTSLGVEIRTSSDGGATWGNWTAKNSGDILVPNGTNLLNYRFQWRANLSTNDAGTTPCLEEVSISNTSGTYTATATADFIGTQTNTQAANDSVQLYGSVDTYTKLLLSCDGTNGSTVFTDSAAGNAITANGNVQVSTAQSKFGGASAYFDGSGDAITAPATDDFNFGSGDLSIDFGISFTSIRSGENAFCGRYNASNGSYTFEYMGDATKRFVGYYNGTTEMFSIPLSNPTSLSTNTWYHIAFCRSGNTMYAFINGALQGTAALSHSFTGNGDFAVGSYNSSGANCINGYIDEFRVSKGIARWTSNFTPSASPYASYQSSGMYTHTEQDISGAGVANNLTLNYSKTTPDNTAISVEVRTSSDGGVTWGNWAVRNSGDIIIPNGTNLSNHRVQWRANLATTDTAVTPSLNEVTIRNGDNYTPSGTYTSPIMDISSEGSASGSVITWISQEAIVGGSVVGAIQVETSLSTDSGISFGPWQAAASGGAIPGITPQTDLDSARLKYRVSLSTSDQTISPLLNEIHLFINIAGNNDPILLPSGKISGINVTSSYTTAAGPLSSLPSQRIFLSGVSPVVMGLSGDGSALYFHNTQDGRLYLLDLFTGTNTSISSITPSVIKVLHNGSRAAFKDSGNSLYLYNRAANNVTTVSASVGDFEFQNDGTLFYYSNNTTYRLASGETTPGTGCLSEAVNYLDVTRTGNQAFYSITTQLSSLSLTPAGWKSASLTTAAKNIDGLWASPSGDLVFYKTADGWFSYQIATKSVRKLDLAATNLVRVTDDNKLVVLGVNSEYRLYDPDTDAFSEIRPADASGTVFDINSVGSRLAYVSPSGLASSYSGKVTRPERYLLSFNNDSVWYSHKSGRWEIVRSGSNPIADDFIKSGMTIEEVNALTQGDFSGLYTDGKEIFSLDVSIYFASVDPYTTPSLKSIVVYMKGRLSAGDLQETPLENLLYAKKQQDFNATGWRQIKKIYPVELYPKDAETYYFITTDNATCKTYKNRQWVTVDPALFTNLEQKWIDIAQQGMRASDLRSIPEEFLSTLLPVDSFTVVYVQKVQDGSTQGYTSQISIDYTATEFNSANLVIKITLTDGTVKQYSNLTRAEVEDFMRWLSQRQFNKGPIFRKVVTGSATPGVTQVNDYINYYLVQFVSVEEMQ